MLVMQTVIKPKDDNHSQKFFTYPYQALEESVTNSLYHRDYREWEPVVITVEPQGITIQNVGGPDRSISKADIERGELLISKRYRNRRLGEYLKELDLTEGRSTGIPTIQNELKENGSPRAIVVTDEERTFFRITIPCHEAAGNIIADIASKDNSQKSSQKSSQKGSQKDAKSQMIIDMIRRNPNVTTSEMADKIGISRRSIAKMTNKLQAEGVILRVGARKDGHWEIVKSEN
jgi:ATP-dependent DNA helicase RecG